MMGQATAAFECTSLSKSFGRRKVLDGLDLRVEPGQRIGLLGGEARTSGCHADADFCGARWRYQMMLEFQALNQRMQGSFQKH
jgi:hypothetical protein